MELNRFIFSIFLLFLHGITINCFTQSDINANRQFYTTYFENNYYTLNNIEGIYSVSLNVNKGITYSENCSYSEFYISDFDEVAIIYRDNRFEINSIKTGLNIGYIESTSHNQDFTSEQLFNPKDLILRMNGKNYPKDNISKCHGRDLKVRPGDCHIDQYSTINIKDKYDYFDGELSKRLSIRCNSEMNEWENLFYRSLTLQYSYWKIFPTSKTLPKPKTFTGTGFLLNRNGFIVTNYHVVQRPSYMITYNNEEIKLIHESTKNVFQGQLVCFDEELDLAVIKINAPIDSIPKIQPLLLSHEWESIGNTVSTVGYPFGKTTGSNIKYTRGYISSEMGPLDAASLYTVDLSINPGNSGGPLLNNRNIVVGVVSARLNDDAVGSKVENIGFAIKSGYVIDFLKSNAIDYMPIKSNDKTEKPIEEIKNGVFMIEYTLKHN